MSETLWQLRYRSPLAPTKGVDDVTIATDSSDETIARTVAEDYLATAVAHPSTRFISLRPLVAHSERAMRERLTKQANAPKADQEATKAVPEARTARVGA